ncbi:MAG: hypothetical protein QM627_08250 [Luteolibacter sp.]
MPRRFAALLILVLFALAPTSFAGGKRGEKSQVSFHMETEESDNPKMIFSYEVAGKKRFFRRLPEVSLRDVTSFSPFPSDDGASYGLVFRLKPNAGNRLNAITSVNQGKWLVASVNGRFVDAVLIDKPVTDGLIVVWQGVSLPEIQLLDQTLPRFGEKKPKKKK